jgi:hypothetical protein
MERKRKLLTAAAALLLAGAGYVFADGYNDACDPCDPCPNAFFDTCGDDVAVAPLPKKMYGVDLDNYNVMFGTKGHETKKLTFFGLIQTDFDYIRTDDRRRNDANTIKDPFETLHFQMRRVRLGVDADLGNCWSGVIDMELGKCSCDVTCTKSQSNRFFTLQMAYIEKVYAGNSFKFGYRKVNFGAEETTHPAKIKTVEYSLATNYFAGPVPCLARDCCGDSATVGASCSSGTNYITGESRLGLSSRHVGLYLDGIFENFGYGLAVTNSFPGLGVSSQYANEIGLYGNAYYMMDLNGLGLIAGVNMAYQPEGNTLWMTTAANNIQCASSPGNEAVRSGIIGWNPYALVYWQSLYILGEMLGARVENGAINTVASETDSTAQNAKPIGYNIVAAYMINDCWEIVGRYTSIDTDQRGVRISHVILNANDVVAENSATETTIFDEADAFYIGFNYYIKNKSIKLAAGYEHATFQGRWGDKETGTLPPTPGDAFAGDKAKVDVFRARVQLVF